MMSKVVVLGGAGNLGSALVDLLVADAHVAQIISLDVVPHKHPGSKVQCVVGDILVPKSLDRHFIDSVVVYHLASMISILPIPPRIMHKINVDGTRNVIQKCLQHGVPTLIYTSSLEVVCGDGVEYKAGDETAPIPKKHYLPYATSKTLAEDLVLRAAGPSLHTVALRSGYIMGRNCVGIRHELQVSKQRHGHYVTARIPARISCVSPLNCATAHILAARKAKQVSGNAYFIRDFDANVVTMNITAFEGTGIKVVLLPLWLAYGLAFFQDLLYRLFYYLGFTWLLSQMKGTIDVNAMNMAWRDICFTGDRARKELGYDSALIPLMSKADTMKEARDFALRFYSDLHAQDNLKSL